MRFIITLFLLSSFSASLMAQKNLSRLEHAMDVDIHRPHFSMGKVNNELSLVFGGLFLFYKNFISSQDGNSCTFTPSCSEFGIQAVQKKGVVVGMLATFDRLTRCNGLSPGQYRYDRQRKLFIDPVD